nr:Uncharacterised protein [Streptococcus thermophilus]
MTLHNDMDITANVHGGFYLDGPGVQVSRRFWIAEPFASARPSELGCSVSGFSALAVFGLRFFADAFHTTLHGAVRKTVEATQYTPRITRTRPRRTWTVRYQGHPIPISTPGCAVVEALQCIRAGEIRWPVGTVDGWCPVDLRALQLIDASRRHLNIHPDLIYNAARNRLPRTWLKRLVGASSDRADSPKETEMRLIARQICEELGVELSEQVTVTDDRGIITTLDLAITELGIGLMYDGEHHLQRSQRDRDSAINIRCVMQGWTVLRFTAGTMGKVAELLRELITQRL